MTVLLIALKYYSSYFLYLLLVFVLGRFLRFGLQKYFPTQSFFTEAFFSLLLGQVALSTLVAIFYTQGQTSHLLFLVLGSFLLFFTKKTREIPSLTKKKYVFEFKNLFWILSISVVVFAWEVYFFLKTGDFPYTIPFVDVCTYSNMSYYLPITGEENAFRYLSLFSSDYQGISRYHYLTLWNNAFVNQVFGNLSLANYILVTVSSFNFCIWIGFLALWECFGKVNWKILLVGLLFLFIGGFILDSYHEMYFLRYSHNLYLNLFDFVGKKASYYYCFWIVTCILFHQKKYYQAVLIILILNVVTFVASPAVLGTLFILIPFLFWQKNIVFKQMLYLFLAILMYLIGISLLSFFWGIRMETSYGFKVVLTNIQHLTYWKTSFNFFVGANIQLFIIYLPYILLLFVFNFNRKLKFDRTFFSSKEAVILTFLLLIVEVPLLVWIIFKTITNTWQLFKYPALSAIHIILIYFIIATIHKYKSRFFIPLLIVLLGFNIYIVTNKHLSRGKGNVQSASYLNSITSLYKQNKIRGFGGVIVNSDFYTTIYTKGMHSIKTGLIVATLDNKLSLINLSSFEIEEAKKMLVGGKSISQTDGVVSRGLFFRFVMTQKKTNTFQNIAQSQINFIKKHNITYLFVAKGGTIPLVLEKSIEQKVVDERSGEQFILLDLSKL